MSNQAGDRYACTDENCGCVIAIEQSCRMLSSEDLEEANSIVKDLSARTKELDSENPGALRGNFRNENIATPGNYGAQGATGEGIFGTARTGDRSATTSGRYDTPGNFVRRSDDDDDETIVEIDEPLSQALSLTCFCGQPMRQVSAASPSSRSRSQSAGA